MTYVTCDVPETKVKREQHMIQRYTSHLYRKAWCKGFTVIITQQKPIAGCKWLRDQSRIASSDKLRFQMEPSCYYVSCSTIYLVYLVYYFQLKTDLKEDVPCYFLIILFSSISDSINRREVHTEKHYFEIKKNIL